MDDGFRAKQKRPPIRELPQYVAYLFIVAWTVRTLNRDDRSLSKSTSILVHIPKYVFRHGQSIYIY